MKNCAKEESKTPVPVLMQSIFKMLSCKDGCSETGPKWNDTQSSTDSSVRSKGNLQKTGALENTSFGHEVRVSGRDAGQLGNYEAQVPVAFS